MAKRQSTYRKILLVCKHEQKRIPELVLVQHALQLLARLDNTITIVAVDDEDDALRVLEVVSPQGSDLVLTTDIPHGELDVLVLDGLDVEACSGQGLDNGSGGQRTVTSAAPTERGCIPMVGIVVTISPSLSL